MEFKLYATKTKNQICSRLNIPAKQAPNLLSPLVFPLFSTRTPWASHSLFSSTVNTPNTASNALFSPISTTTQQTDGGISSTLTRSSSLLSEENESTDIEKILNDQQYKRKTKNSKNKTTPSCDFKQNTQKCEEFNIKSKKYSKKCSRIFIPIAQDCGIRKESRGEKETIKRIIVPDIPKAAFGVHRAYHELNVTQDFKTIEVKIKPREPRYRSRNLSLDADKQLRDKILYDLILSKHQNP
jgi:hypothetical protein